MTDRTSYDRLAGAADLDEVNFWRPNPSGRPHLAPGTPFFFKLKSPTSAGLP